MWAHLEHPTHDFDTGGVPAQRLVEGRRVLPLVASRARGAGRAAGREGGGGEQSRCMQRAHGARSVHTGEGCATADIGAKRGEQRT